MKMYTPKGKAVDVHGDQVTALLAAGWTKSAAPKAAPKQTTAPKEKEKKAPKLEVKEGQAEE